jgi:hypothetical protein
VVAGLYFPLFQPPGPEESQAENPETEGMHLLIIFVLKQLLGFSS